MKGFFKKTGKAINDTVHKHHIDEKLINFKDKVAQGAKNFGENHPTVQNAATTTMKGIKTAGNYVAETTNKVVHSEPVQNAGKKISETYHGAINSETAKNLSKKAEEQYINLKKSAKKNFGNKNEQQNTENKNQQNGENNVQNKQPIDNNTPNTLNQEAPPTINGANQPPLENNAINQQTPENNIQKPLH